MHAEAFDWVHIALLDVAPTARVLDIGGRNINGSPRALLPTADYIAVDITPGAGVDVVADCTTWRPPSAFDIAICAEVAEHLEDWPTLVDCAYESLRPGGRFVFTAAGPGRAPHSAADGGPLRPGEWYRNIEPADLKESLVGFTNVVVDVLGPDVRATATKEE